jgi:hypothetical protein
MLRRLFLVLLLMLPLRTAQSDIYPHLLVVSVPAAAAPVGAGLLAICALLLIAFGGGDAAREPPWRKD